MTACVVCGRLWRPQTTHMSAADNDSDNYIDRDFFRLNTTAQDLLQRNRKTSPKRQKTHHSKRKVLTLLIWKRKVLAWTPGFLSSDLIFMWPHASHMPAADILSFISFRHSGIQAFSQRLFLQLWELWVPVALYCCFNCSINCSTAVLNIVFLFYIFFINFWRCYYTILSLCVESWDFFKFYINLMKSDLYKFYINLINKEYYKMTTQQSNSQAVFLTSSKN